MLGVTKAVHFFETPATQTERQARFIRKESFISQRREFETCLERKRYEIRMIFFSLTVFCIFPLSKNKSRNLPLHCGLLISAFVTLLSPLFRGILLFPHNQCTNCNHMRNRGERLEYEQKLNCSDDTYWQENIMHQNVFKSVHRSVT